MDIDGGYSFINKTTGFGPGMNVYHCALCYGARAMMCSKFTSVVDSGFVDFRSALQHILAIENHIEYSLGRKLASFAEEVSGSKGVRAAFRSVFGVNGMEDTMRQMRQGEMPLQLRRFLR